MNKNIKKITLFTTALIILLAGCTNAGVASSWPGLALSNDTGYFSYGTQIFAIDTKNGSEIWRFPLEPDNRHQYYAAVATQGDLLVAGSYSDRLAAVDINSGLFKWAFDGAVDKYIGSALISDEVIFAPNSDGFLYALDLDGNLLWKFKADGPNWTAPVTDGDLVFMASMDHFLYTFRVENPEVQLGLDKTGDAILLPEPFWKIDLNAAVVAKPVIADGMIYVGTIDGTLYAISVAGRNVAWSITGGEDAGSIWGSPVITSEAIYFGDEKGNLYAVSPDDGSALWSTPYSAGASLIAGGVETEEGILYITDEGRIFTINLEKEPKPVTNLEMVMYATPLYINGRVVIAPASKDELFKALDLNGKEIWKFIPSK